MSLTRPASEQQAVEDAALRLRITRLDRCPSHLNGVTNERELCRRCFCRVESSRCERLSGLHVTLVCPMSAHGLTPIRLRGSCTVRYLMSLASALWSALCLPTV